MVTWKVFLGETQTEEVIHLQETGHYIYYGVAGWIHSPSCSKCRQSSRPTSGSTATAFGVDCAAPGAKDRSVKTLVKNKNGGA